MRGRANRSVWVAALVFAVSGAGSFAQASEPGAGDAGQAYRMTLQILGGMSSCGDEWSPPEYYAAASRRDPQVEEELDGIEDELDRLEPRIEAFDERIEPLRRREHNTVPLTEDEREELEELRGRRLEVQGKLAEKRQLPFEERQALEREQSETARSVQRLEDSIPLTDEEARLLRDQKDQRAPLDARRSILESRQAELKGLISMRTPGSLRVYANDSLRLRLMESDAFADDTCATWSLALEEDILDRGGIDLKNGDRALLRLWVQQVPAGFDDGAPR